MDANDYPDRSRSPTKALAQCTAPTTQDNMSAAEAVAGTVDNISGDVSAASTATISPPVADIASSLKTLSIGTARDDPKPAPSEPAEEADAPAAIPDGTSVCLVPLWLCAACGD